MHGGVVRAGQGDFYPWMMGGTGTFFSYPSPKSIMKRHRNFLRPL